MHYYIRLQVKKKLNFCCNSFWKYYKDCVINLSEIVFIFGAYHYAINALVYK